MPHRRLVLVLATAAVALAAAPAPAVGADRQHRRASGDETRTMRVAVRIQKFRVQGRKVVAKGVARAGIRDESGNLQTATKPVTFQVDGGSGCRVLTLELETLHLELLGLIVDTSAVNLRITGQRRGGALGRLFCRLARGIRLKRKLRAHRAARSLNRRIDRRGMRAIAFSARVQPSDRPAEEEDGDTTAHAAQEQPPPGSCQVLDLILGPLNLDLLGLRVDLYGASRTEPVRVLITADPNGGVLGQVFCRLARGEEAQPPPS